MGKLNDFVKRMAELPPRRAALLTAGGGLVMLLGAVGYVAWHDAPFFGFLLAIGGAVAYFSGCYALAVRPAAWMVLLVAAVALAGVIVGPATARNAYLSAVGEESSCRVTDYRADETTDEPGDGYRRVTVFLACPDGSRPVVEEGVESGVGTDVSVYQDPHGWAAPVFADLVEGRVVNTIGAAVAGLLVTIPFLAYAVARRRRPR